MRGFGEGDVRVEMERWVMRDRGSVGSPRLALRHSEIANY